MGNNHSDVSNYFERIPLGDSAGNIVLRKTKISRGRQVEDTWTAEYSIGRTRCEVCLTITNRNKHDEELSISLHDHEPAPSNEDVDFHMGLKVEQDCLVSKLTINGPRSLSQLPNCKDNNPEAQGGVIKSSSFLYGRDTDERKGLIVILRAKRSDDDEEWPYMIVVKHYLFVSAQDVGLYAVAKIHKVYGYEDLSVQLEKPMRQDKRKLLSLFNDVKRKGWRPNYSVDFAIEHPSNQNKGKVPGAPLLNGQPFVPPSRSLVNSAGSNYGNYNGSIIINHIYHEEQWAKLRHTNESEGSYSRNNVFRPFLDLFHRLPS